MGTHRIATAQVTTLEELLALRPDEVWPDQSLIYAGVGRDPLRESDLLREAVLLDVRCECVRMTAALLVDMRLGIGGLGGDVVLIVARGVRSCSWDLGAGQGDHGPLETLYGGFWWVGSSDCKPDATHPDWFAFEIGCASSALLKVRAERFDYFLADVPGLPDFPDMGAGPDALVRASLPDWQKPVRLTGYSRRDPTRR